MTRSIARLAFVGYGALGKQIAQMMEETNHPGCSQARIYFDDVMHQQGLPDAYPYSSYLSPEFEDCMYIVAIGYKHLQEKQRVLENLRGGGGKQGTTGGSFPSSIPVRSSLQVPS